MRAEDKKPMNLSDGEGQNCQNGSFDSLRGIDVPDDGLPDALEDLTGSLPPLAPEVIEHVLRRGHKMFLAGPSKAGKSFALIELAICIAEGLPWMGFKCAQGKVMYVNLELDRASCLHRFRDVRQAMGAPSQHGVSIWNLRGMNVDMESLARAMVARYRKEGYIVVIIDPIYKVMRANENSAYETAQFCNLLDKVCMEMNCSVVYCHHHSKGDQSWKKSMDRASGSGVFARDADAILDVIELELPPDARDAGRTAWRLSGTLREFQSFPPVDMWFDHPLHRLAEFNRDEVAPHHELPSWRRAMYARKPKKLKHKERNTKIMAAYDLCRAEGDTPTISTLAAYLGISPQTVRNYVDQHPELKRENGVVSRI